MKPLTFNVCHLPYMCPLSEAYMIYFWGFYWLPCGFFLLFIATYAHQPSVISWCKKYSGIQENDSAMFGFLGTSSANTST